MKNRSVLCGACVVMFGAGYATAQDSMTAFRIGAAEQMVKAVGQRADGATRVERLVTTREGRVIDRIGLALLPEFIVELEPGTDARAIAALVDTRLVRTMRFGERVFAVVRTDTGEGASRACAEREGQPGVLGAETLIEGSNAPTGGIVGAPLNDTRFRDQWHHENTGQSGGFSGEDAKTVDAWSLGYSGVGSTILIVDNGVQTNHPDLAARMNLAGSWDIDQGINDPNPKVLNDRHGTACAGIAAADDDGTNTVGVAYNAEISGWRVDFPTSTGLDFAQAFEYRLDINEITNNSYGPNDAFLFVAPVSSVQQAAIDNSIANGRNGLGSIHVKSAGNGLGFDDDSNFDGLSNSRYFIAVSATDHFGRQSSYSEPGANILVNAPSSGSGVGTVTSDVEGRAVVGDGYTAGSCTTPDFGGTSSAGPLVAGVVALMLEANPNLTWRDVQRILAYTAFQNDPSDVDWTLNGAGHWVNHKYGFGRVDAGAAGVAAETWVTLPETIAEEYDWGVTSFIPIPDDGVNDVELTLEVVASAIESVEFVEFTVDLQHEWQGDVEITLISPDGTRSRVEGRENDSDDGFDYTFTSRRHLDENPNGTWTLRLFDSFPFIDSGNLFDASLRLIGIPADTTVCEADFNNDGGVALGDFGFFGAAFGTSEGDPRYDGRADFNADGSVDLGDFGAFGQQFGRTDC